MDGGKALSLLQENLVNGPLQPLGSILAVVLTSALLDSNNSQSKVHRKQGTLIEKNCDQTGDDGSESGHNGGEEGDDADIDGMQYL